VSHEPKFSIKIYLDNLHLLAKLVRKTRTSAAERRRAFIEDAGTVALVNESKDIIRKSFMVAWGSSAEQNNFFSKYQPHYN